MSRESTAALKERLLSDPEVQMMIRMRAYEIYLMHLGQSGSPAEDWFRAESEVLFFLIEEESRRATEEAQEPALETVAGIELAPHPAATADPETSGGEATTEPPKQTRARSATKTTATRSKKAADGTAKKTATRATAKKTTDSEEKPAKRAAAKKTADSADKPKRTRKKPETATT